MKPTAKDYRRAAKWHEGEAESNASWAREMKHNGRSSYLINEARMFARMYRIAARACREMAKRKGKGKS